MGSWFSKKSRDPPDSFDSLMETGWCDIPWSRDTLEKPKETLRALQPKHPDVEHLRILVIGPVGAGKSSFIHSIDSIFQNKIMNASYRVATDQRSFTNTFTTYTFQDQSGNRLPFVIGDVMGLENEDDSGANTEDIVNALKGHIKENYTFNSVKACSVNDPGYNSNPTLNDKVHCLVFVIPIDNFANHAKERATVLMHDNLIRKMQNIRRKARDLRIRQVIILTKVDLDCHHVTEGIKNVYRSKNIHQKAEACSKALGIPKSDIFLVSNYHNDKQLNSDKDEVLLFTLTQILNYANEFVEDRRKSMDTGMAFAGREKNNDPR
ncbi:interferon-induced protein 44-like isoform X2 [Alosa sapidissima]|uniref:interferon-induced protein 44-like isoform X2 n=1 Tax=Alosa sapidissima TaxID=34773 RepID=UPI001C095E7B|nr:interferon-induced protein 44-like isoform X2 [Alosa sapidissima]